jgi:hypothetical protein
MASERLTGLVMTIRQAGLIVFTLRFRHATIASRSGMNSPQCAWTSSMHACRSSGVSARR